MSALDVQDLRREIADLRRQLAQRPMRVPGNRPYQTASVLGGNTLPSGQLGIVYASTPLTQFSSAWDPEVGGAMENGVGYGYLYRDGTSAGRVLIINDGRSSITYPLVMSWQGVVTGTVTLPVSGSPSTFLTAYVIGGV